MIRQIDDAARTTFKQGKKVAGDVANAARIGVKAAGKNPIVKNTARVGALIVVPGYATQQAANYGARRFGIYSHLVGKEWFMQLQEKKWGIEDWLSDKYYCGADFVEREYQKTRKSTSISRLPEQPEDWTEEIPENPEAERAYQA